MTEESVPRRKPNVWRLAREGRKLVAEAISAETTSFAGRCNIITIVSAVALMVVYMITDFQASIEHNAETGLVIKWGGSADFIIWFLLLLFVFSVCCMAIVTYTERLKNNLGPNEGSPTS